MKKLKILGFLVSHPDADARTVSEHLCCSPEAAGMALLRLNRQGLVVRAWDPDTCTLYYNLSPKGHARLEYWARRAPGTARSKEAQP